MKNGDFSNDSRHFLFINSKLLHFSLKYMIIPRLAQPLPYPY